MIRGYSPEQRSVDGDDNIFVVHLLEQGSDPGAGHHARPPRHGLTDVPEHESRQIELDSSDWESFVENEFGNPRDVYCKNTLFSFLLRQLSNEKLCELDQEGN